MVLADLLGPSSPSLIILVCAGAVTGWVELEVWVWAGLLGLTNRQKSRGSN